jgi:hypothetical protein
MIVQSDSSATSSMVQWLAAMRHNLNVRGTNSDVGLSVFCDTTYTDGSLWKALQ